MYDYKQSALFPQCKHQITIALSIRIPFWGFDVDCPYKASNPRDQPYNSIICTEKTYEGKNICASKKSMAHIEQTAFHQLLLHLAT